MPLSRFETCLALNSFFNIQTDAKKLRPFKNRRGFPRVLFCRGFRTAKARRSAISDFSGNYSVDMTRSSGGHDPQEPPPYFPALQDRIICLMDGNCSAKVHLAEQPRPALRGTCTDSKHIPDGNDRVLPWDLDLFTLIHPVF